MERLTPEAPEGDVDGKVRGFRSAKPTRELREHVAEESGVEMLKQCDVEDPGGGSLLEPAFEPPDAPCDCRESERAQIQTVIPVNAAVRRVGSISQADLADVDERFAQDFIEELRGKLVRDLDAFKRLGPNP